MQLAAPVPVRAASTPTPIRTVPAPALSTPTRPTVYDLTIPSPHVTPPSPPSLVAEPSDFHSISLTQTSNMGIKKQIEEIQRERLNYYRAKPIGIDLTSYTYSTLPPPYQRLAGYMQIHNLVVPEDWQDLETPYGHLPLADPTKGNQFTCCAPKLRDFRDFRAFAQIDECNAYCMHEAWPYDLVVSVLVPDTCRWTITTSMALVSVVTTSSSPDKSEIDATAPTKPTPRASHSSRPI